LNWASATAISLISAAALMTWSSDTLAEEPIKINFEGEHADKPLTLHIQKGWRDDKGASVPNWRPVCSSPCNSALPAGTYRFGLSVQGKEPTGTDTQISLTYPSVVRGSYVSNANVRMIGYGLIVGGPLLGGFLWLPHATQDVGPSDGAQDERRVTKYAAIGIATAGLIGGMVMTVIPDRALIRIVPMSRTGDVSWSSERAFDAMLPTGLEASYQF